MARPKKSKKQSKSHEDDVQHTNTDTDNIEEKGNESNSHGDKEAIEGDEELGRKDEGNINDNNNNEEEDKDEEDDGNNNDDNKGVEEDEDKENDNNNEEEDEDQKDDGNSIDVNKDKEEDEDKEKDNINVDKNNKEEEDLPDDELKPAALDTTAVSGTVNNNSTNPPQSNVNTLYEFEEGSEMLMVQNLIEELTNNQKVILHTTLSDAEKETKLDVVEKLAKQVSILKKTFKITPGDVDHYFKEVTYKTEEIPDAAKKYIRYKSLIYGRNLINSYNRLQNDVKLLNVDRKFLSGTNFYCQIRLNNNKTGFEVSCHCRCNTCGADFGTKFYPHGDNNKALYDEFKCVFFLAIYKYHFGLNKTEITIKLKHGAITNM